MLKTIGCFIIRLNRCFRPEDRKSLENTSDVRWEDCFKAYLSDLECPHQIRLEQIDWLLSKAVESKFNSKPEYKTFSAETAGKQKPIPPAFNKGLKNLAQKLQVQIHDEKPEVTLEACKIVVEALVTSKDNVENLKDKMMKKSAVPLGFDTGDPVMNEAGAYLITTIIKFKNMIHLL